MGEKKVNGRKRHILVDTLGLLLRVVVHPADIQDREGARLLLADISHRLPRLQHLWADSGYTGDLIDWAKRKCHLTLAVVTRPADQKGFVLLPRRWVVERTFAWFGRYRRLRKDDEHLAKCSESMVYLASIQLMIHRVAT